MVEPGTYTGVFRSIEVGKSPNTGTPCVATVWHIEEEDCERTVYTYINKNTQKISFAKLDSIGFNGDFDNPDVSIETVQLRCIHSEYNEQMREKWDFASWGGASVQEADKKVIKDLNAQWKKEFGAPPKKKKSSKKDKPAPPPEPEPEEVEEEEEEEEADTSGMTPREIAWGAFLEHQASEDAIEGLENGKSAKATMEWAALISKAIPSKEEEDFTAEDWEGVRLYCSTPM